MSLSTHEPVERLIETYGQEVYKIAYFYMKNTQLAEDVFQEVFYKVMKNYDKFQHQSSEKTWLIRITINTCKDMLRTSWIKRVTTFGVYQDSKNDYEKPFDIAQQETNRELYELIQKLPSKYKEVILLFYYKELSYEEISEILKIENEVIIKLMKLANIKKNKLSAILLDKLPGLTFESNAAKPSPVSIVIAVECLIIPKTNGSNPISTVANVIPAKLIN